MNTSTDASSAGVPAPENGDGQLAPELGPKRIEPPWVVRDQKLFATAQARLALKGFELVAMPGGGYVSQQWGHVRALATMADVEAFATQVGA